MYQNGNLQRCLQLKLTRQFRFVHANRVYVRTVNVQNLNTRNVYLSVFVIRSAPSKQTDLFVATWNVYHVLNNRYNTLYLFDTTSSKSVYCVNTLRTLLFSRLMTFDTRTHSISNILTFGVYVTVNFMD